MKPMGLVILLSLCVPVFAKTSTDLFFCGGLEIGIAALNAVASICSDSVILSSNQTDIPKLHTTLKTSTATYGTSALLMILTGAISIFDSRIDYAPGRTNKVVPWVITGISLGSVLISTIGVITSSLSFVETYSSSMLGTSVGATLANWIVFVGALKWTYDMKVLEPHGPNV